MSVIETVLIYGVIPLAVFVLLAIATLIPGRVRVIRDGVRTSALMLKVGRVHLTVSLIGVGTDRVRRVRGNRVR